MYTVDDPCDLCDRHRECQARDPRLGPFCDEEPDEDDDEGLYEDEDREIEDEPNPYLGPLDAEDLLW